jgi:phosphoglycerate kinase
MVRRALATSATPNKGDLGADVLTLPDVPLASLQNKVVFVRCDFNVKYDKAPAGGFVVKPTSFKRIDESLPTLRHLIDTGARIVVASHLGDPTKEDLADPAARAKLSLAPVAAALETCLGHPVAFAADCVGPVAAAAVKALPSGGLLLLENLRFHAGEKKNDPAFVQSLVDTVQPAAYINDAFGTGTSVNSC